MKIFFCIILLLLTVNLTADKLTVEEFIMDVDQDFKLKNQHELVVYYQNTSESTPFIDKIEFRTELEDFDKYDQKYSLKLYPKGFGETSSRAKILKKTKEETKLQYEEYYNDALNERYELIINYIETKKLIKYYQELQSIYQDRIVVLKKLMATSEEFDMVRLITAEDKLFNFELELVKLEDTITSLTFKIYALMGEKGEIDFKNLISIKQIKKNLLVLSESSGFDNILIKNSKLKVELAKYKYDLEVAKTRDYLSFLKFGYRTKDYEKTHKFRSAFSIGVGIKLPFINPDRDQINEKKARYIEEKLKLGYLVRDNEEKISSINRSLKRALKQYDILLKREEKGNATISFKKYQEIDGVNPLTLLKLKESMIDNQILILKIKSSIRLKYIKILDKLGRLTKKPLKNYLVDNKE